MWPKRGRGSPRSRSRPFPRRPRAARLSSPPDEVARGTCSPAHFSRPAAAPTTNTAGQPPLVAALDEQEKKAVAYATTLEDARRTAAQLATVATEIELRVGRDRPGQRKLALQATAYRHRALDADAATVLLHGRRRARG